MRLQSHWKRLAAIDFGMRDTNVVTFGAYDEETQIYYIYDEMLHTNTDAAIIALSVKTKQNGYIPMIYPADGDAERGVGTTYAQIYKNAGCILTNEQARNWELDKEGKDRTIGPGIAFIRQLMLEGRLKISPTCTGFLKEMDQYSYDDKGKFIDKNNHSVDSVRYLIMGIRKFGKVKQAQQKPNRKQEYIEF